MDGNHNVLSSKRATPWGDASVACSRLPASSCCIPFNPPPPHVRMNSASHANSWPHRTMEARTTAEPAKYLHRGMIGRSELPGRDCLQRLLCLYGSSSLQPSGMDDMGCGSHCIFQTCSASA